MKIHKITTIICSIISFFTLAFAILFFIIADNVANTNCADTFTFVSNIMLGVFGSSFVLLISSIVFYFVEKQKTIGVILFYNNEIFIQLINLTGGLFKSNGDYVECDVDYAYSVLKNNAEIFELVKEIYRTEESYQLNYSGYYPYFKNSKKNKKILDIISFEKKIEKLLESFIYAYESEHLTFLILSNKNRPDDNIKDEKEIKDNIKYLFDLTSENSWGHIADVHDEIMKSTKIWYDSDFTNEKEVK